MATVFSDEVKKRISKKLSGRTISEQTRERMRVSQKKRVLEGRSNLKIGNKTIGEAAPIWMGDKVGYCALHSWVRRWKGKAKKCEFCGKEGNSRQIHWANKDHKYKRILDDFIALCTACHRKYDKENNQYTPGRNKRTG